LAGPIVHAITSYDNDDLEGLDVDDSACSSRAAVSRGSAGVAVQQIMGLLPKRRTGVGSRDLACTASGRATVDCQLLLAVIEGLLLVIFRSVNAESGKFSPRR